MNHNYQYHKSNEIEELKLKIEKQETIIKELTTKINKLEGEIHADKQRKH